jgi:hypothetical protein
MKIMSFTAIKYRYLSLLFICLLFFLGCRRPDTFFTSLPASQTHIQFANNLEQKTNLGILSYIYYYKGAGVVIGNIFILNS